MFGGGYSSYLQSDEWQRKRTRVLQQRGAKCEVCGIKHRLQVHHLTYERLGSELLSDLKVLCWLATKGNTVCVKQNSLHLSP